MFGEPNIYAKITQLSEVGALLIPEAPIDTHSVFVLQFHLPKGMVRIVCRVLRQHVSRNSILAVEFEYQEDIPKALSAYVDEMFMKKLIGG